MPSASLRGLAWGLDGVALVVASALLAVHFLRLGHNLPAAGFLVFVAGETLIVSVSPNFSPKERIKAALYGIKVVSSNNYAKGEEQPLWEQSV
jgi:hypothetical protein